MPPNEPVTGVAPRAPRRRQIRWVWAAMLLTTAACGPPDLDARLVTYQDQVSRLLADGNGPPRDAGLDSGGFTHYPRRRDRWLPVADRRIGGFDFIALQGCRLSQLVGQRNSQMGKAMVPSRQLVYELDVLAAADGCIGSLGSERAERLAAIVREKRGELPAHVFNAVWNGEEMEGYLSTTAGPLAIAADPDDTAGLDAVLAVLRRPLASPSAGEALEVALGLLRREAPAGASLAQLARVAEHLDAVAARLESRHPRVCGAVEIRLAQVFEASYLTLQREMGALDRRALTRLESLDALFSETASRLSNPPPAMVAYHRTQLSAREESGPWRRYRGAVERHTRAWEPLLVACGSLPGANAPDAGGPGRPS